jgi:hypothetical protein
MSFKTIAAVTAAVGLVLGIGYIFFGALIVGRWHVEAAPGVLLLARRIGCLYLGLAAMLFLSRSAPASPARAAIAGGAAISLLLLAMLGSYEFYYGRAGRGIMISAALETLLAFGFIWSLFKGRNN